MHVRACVVGGRRSMFPVSHFYYCIKKSNMKMSIPTTRTRTRTRTSKSTEETSLSLPRLHRDGTTRMFVLHFGRRTSPQQKMPCACTQACMHARCEALRLQLERRHTASAARVFAPRAISRHHTSVMYEYNFRG